MDFDIWFCVFFFVSSVFLVGLQCISMVLMAFFHLTGSLFGHET